MFSLFYDRHFISSSLFFLPGEGELFRVDIFVKYPFPFLMKICVKNDQKKKKKKRKKRGGGPFILNNFDVIRSLIF